MPKRHSPFWDADRKSVQNGLAVLGGSYVFPFFKGGAEACLTVKAGAECNVFDGHLCGFQKIFCRRQAGLDQILMRRDSCLLRKHSGEMKWTHIRLGCQLFQRQVLLKMLIDVRNGVSHGDGAGLTWRSPNPYDSEAYYNLGLSQFCQEKYDEAYDSFYKATWTNEQQEMSWYYLAVIACRRGDYELALDFVEKGLIKNTHNIKARGLKAAVLRVLGKKDEACAWIAENLKTDPFDYVSRYEAVLNASAEEKEARLKELKVLMRDFHENYLQTARDCAEAGFFEEALEVLDGCTKEWPMLFYYRGAYLLKLGRADEAKEAFACFNKLMDYGERHLNDKVKNDFFAVSLPDFLIFEDDMDRRNKAHCYYLMGLANIGLGNPEAAVKDFDKALEYDFNHQNCRIYKELAKRELSQ